MRKRPDPASVNRDGSHHSQVDPPLSELASVRFLDLTLPTIEENLALDEVLLNEVEAGRGEILLRLWELPRYAVVLGASGRIREEVFVEHCDEDHVPISRRSSGGGTVVLGPGALNLTVILGRDFAPGLEAVDLAQSFILNRIARSLSSLGTDVEVRGSGDLTIDNRKVAGSAQRRLKSHFLVHASVLYDFAIERIPRYLRLPVRQPSYREGRTHEEFVANLPLPRAVVVEAIRTAWELHALSLPVTSVLEDRIRELVESKFGERSWVWRV